MKKNSYLILTIFLFLIASMTVFGQERDPRTKMIRCSTVERDEVSRKSYPERGTLDEFESWIKIEIEKNKKDKNNGGQTKSIIGGIITIPMIFHIMTDLTGAENISAFQVQAQVDQLNLDFRNLAGSTNGVAADVEIEFCLATTDPSGNILAEPGIHRVTTYGDGPFTDTYVDGTIKPGTSWNPVNYCNVWIADISGGLLGWAQFPDNPMGLAGLNTNGGSANTDGVVCLYSSVGSIANPFPGGGVYAAGRTMTHELGHWLGLRHIWGDGGCSVDDFCADTPTAGAANFGCPEGHISCSSVDMIENYMDYTDDGCMNIFTADQKARIVAVMNNSPRRFSLQASTKCEIPGPPVPEIGFALNSGGTLNENASCDFQDVVVNLTISTAPSANATVTFGTTGLTTATSGLDYTIFPATVTFPAGSTANQSVTLRIFNDILTEVNEIVELNYIISTTGNAVSVAGILSTFDVTIVSGGNAVLLNENFEGAHAGWTTTGNAGSDLFLYDVVANANSTYWTISNSNTTKFAYSNDDECHCDKSNDKLTSPVFSLVGYTGATLTFDHAFSDYSSETAGIRISTGGAFTALQTIAQTQTTSNTPWINGVTVDLTPYIGQPSVQIQFYYNDGALWGYGLAIDNVKITATGASSSITTYATDVQTSCGPYTWIDGNTYTSNNNTATWTVPNSSGCDSVITLNLTITNCSATLGITAFIEGYYLPESSPAAMNPAIYTNRVFAGSSSPGNPTDVDSVVVELHNGISHGLEYSCTAILNTNGQLTCNFPSAVVGNSYYIVLKHKNTLETWSSSAISFGTTTNYNFSSSASQAFDYGVDPAMVQLAAGVFGLYSGDINQDGFIDGFDYGQFALEQNTSSAGSYGLDSDLNGDGFVDSFDYPLFFSNSSYGRFVQYP